jgi:hypothetical protein
MIVLKYPIIGIPSWFFNFFPTSHNGKQPFKDVMVKKNKKGALLNQSFQCNVTL